MKALKILITSNHLKSIFIILFLLIISGPIIFYKTIYSKESNDSFENIDLRVMLHTVEKKDEDEHDKAMRRWEEEITKKLKNEIKVNSIEIVPVKKNIDARLTQFESKLKSNKNTVDVFAIDYIWTKELAKYSEDLNDLVGNNDNIFILDSFMNNLVDDKLIAIPWYLDIGLLLYRKDLINKYKSFLEEENINLVVSEDNSVDLIPSTWDELEKAARIIQKEERQARDQRGRTEDFWGLIWEGEKKEGFHCVVIEWITSHGGMVFNHENEFNTGYENIENIIKSINRVNNQWIKKDDDGFSLSPTKPYSFKKVLTTWRKGNALYMRNWPFAYYKSLEMPEENSEFIEFKKSDIGVMLIPPDTKNGKYASTIGGWQLMVNKNSPSNTKRAAKAFVKALAVERDKKLIKIDKDYVTIPESLTLTTGKFPSLISLYKDREIIEKLPPIFEKHEITDFKMKKLGALSLENILKNHLSISYRESNEKYSEFSEDFISFFISQINFENSSQPNTSEADLINFNEFQRDYDKNTSDWNNILK